MNKPLTTAEHAHLLGLQQALDAATNERDAFVRFLASQHGTNAQEWQLDLGTGAWMPIEKAKPGPLVEEDAPNPYEPTRTKIEEAPPSA